MAAACSAHCSISGRLNSSPFALPRTATSAIFSFKPSGRNRLCVRAKVETDDCNEEACAPEKEVGKVSMEWVAEEKTQVVGTYPPVSRKWTGYVEKDTAGQTNIYSVEPTVYVADSAISSGEAGISSQGSQQTATIAISLGVVMLAGVSVVLSQVGNSSPTAESFEYSGPSLSYYVKKFSASLITETLASPDIQNAPAPEVSSSISEVSGKGFQSESGPSTGA